MIKVSVDSGGLVLLKAEIVGMGKQLRFAASRALNTAAFEAAQATKREMSGVFQSPTPWVLGGVRYKKSTKENLTAQVDFDYWGNKQGVTVEQVLKAEIHGGRRRLKRFEIALQRIGVLPSGMVCVPGDAAKLDAFGNMSPGQINQILSWFQAFGEQGYRANMKDAGKRRLAKDRAGSKGFSYFALKQPHGKLLPGIYQRFSFGAGSAVKPVIIFVRSANYRKRLDFYGLAEKTARDVYDRVFPEYMDQAIRTAR